MFVQRFLLPMLFLVAHATSASVVTEWNGAVLAAIRPQTPPPLLLVRNLSIIHRGAHDAVVLASAPADSDSLFLKELAASAPPGPVPPAAASAYAAHYCASILFPSTQALFDALLEDQTIGLDGETRQRAEALGLHCAKGHIDFRKADRLSSGITYVPRREPGQWRRTPPKFRPPELPQGRFVKPYVLEEIEPHLPPPPPPMESVEWADALAQIHQIGARESPARTEEQSLIARFWSDFSYTITPPGHWNQIAAAIARERDFTLLEEAHLLAGLNMAMLDAGIVCWEAKYRYNFWRPITAIHEAARDGNPLTDADPEWDSYLESPPHPEYPSGHSSFSGAAARFLQLYFAADRIRFSTTSDSVPGHTRTFESLWACAEEISWSRIWGGIHYLFSGEAGLRAGAKVAGQVYRTLP